jgi:hypothetical protein
MVSAGGYWSQSLTKSIATSGISGVGIILPLVTIHRKPKMTIQVKPKGSSLERESSSHFFALE